MWIANLNSNPSCKSLNLDGKFFKMLMNVKYFFCIMYYMFICECYFFEVITLLFIEQVWPAQEHFWQRGECIYSDGNIRKNTSFNAKFTPCQFYSPIYVGVSIKAPLSLASAVTSFNKSWLTCHYTLSSYLKFRLNGGMSNYNSKGPVS